MGKRGPMPKHPDTRQRRNKVEGQLVVLPGDAIDTPAADASWLPDVVDEWHSFWSTDVAAAVRDSDLPALYRLWSLRDLQRKLFAVGAETPLVAGSQGQTVINPALRQADNLSAEIRQLEDRFGLTPAARARLGLDTSKLQRSLDTINSEVVKSAEESDPRAYLLASEAD